MDSAQVLLQCMQGASSAGASPGHLHDHYIATNGHDEAHLINKKGDITFTNVTTAGREPLAYCAHPPSGSLARFYARGSSIILEPFVENVYINTPPIDRPGNDVNNEHCSIPPSTPDCQRFIYLRFGDTVKFGDQSYQVAIRHDNTDQLAANSVEVKNSNTADVQVESSVQEPLHTPGAPKQDDDETEDDLDGSDLPGVKTPPELDESTPATSRPNVAVKETPTHPSSVDSIRQYSTAPDQIQPSLAQPNFAKSTALTGRSLAKGAQESATHVNDQESQNVFPHHDKKRSLYGGGSRARSSKTPVRSPKPTTAPVVQSDDVDEVMAKNDTEGLDEPGTNEDDEENMNAEMKFPNSPKRSLSMGDDTGDAAGGARKRAKVDHLPDDAKEDEYALPHTEDKVPLSEVKVPPKRGRKPKTPKQPVANGEEEQEPEAQPPSTGKLTGVKGKRAPGPATKQALTHSSPVVEIQPPSQSLSTRASATPQSSTVSPKPPTRILLSSTDYAKGANFNKANTFLKRHGATIEDSVPGKRSNFVCVVGTGELHSTAKLLRSLTLGKRVVTDLWLTESMKQGTLLGLDEYVHDDISETLDVNRGALFKGKMLFFTESLKKSYGSGFASVEEIAKDAGAKKVESGALAKVLDKKDGDVVIMGKGDGDDADAEALLREHGKTVYTKNLLSQSIIRGELLVDGDEFVVKLKAAGSAKKGKGKK